MPNFPGAIVYPLVARTPMVDVCSTLVKGREVSIPRGGNSADFNVYIRGAGQRVDRKPVKPEL